MSEEAPKPPPPPPAPSPSSSSPSSPAPGEQVGGMDVNVAAALSYFVIIGIIWLILEPYNKNRFVRFHAFQAIGLAVVWTGISFVLGFIPIIGWIALPFVSLAIFVVWVICFVKAFQNQWFKLPVIGDFSMQQAEQGGAAK
jgi:uncharacterized membrane protein